VTFRRETLKARLRELQLSAAPPSRYVVAFSGGLDSTVLAHALCAITDQRATPIIAVHVDHGLQADAAAWGAHCAQVARELGIDYQVRSVAVSGDSGAGPEAAARDARYAALHDVMQDGDWLLSAHHREDQAETLLLNLIRGSGPAGIAGIGAIRRFGPGWLVRPLLQVGRAALEAYADHAGLEWIEDPSNTDLRFDRNYLRHEVLPRLRDRWPDTAAKLERSAAHASEAAELIDDLAGIDLAALGGRPERLPIDGLTALSPARRKNLLRHALRQLGLPTPTAMHLDRIQNEVIPAREDAQPLVAWPGAEVRRYRNGLYLLPEEAGSVPLAAVIAGDGIALGAGLGRLQLQRGAPAGLSESLVDAGLQLKFRAGGERFQPAGHTHTRTLKNLLQEEGIVPWMRDRLPLVYAGDRLVAVADLWLAADAVSSPGVAVLWDNRPALY